MRKKLFAILMSAMMMVTFMPSMAFAAAPAKGQTPAQFLDEQADEAAGVAKNVKAFAGAEAHVTACGIAKKDLVTETVLAATHDANKLVKKTCPVCGDSWIEETENSKAGHSYVTKTMTYEEYKAFATSTTRDLLGDFVKGLMSADDLYDAIKVLIGFNGSDEGNVDRVLGLIGDAVEAYWDAAIKVKETLREDVEKEKDTKKVYYNAYAGMVAAVETALGEYFGKLDAKVAGYLYSQTPVGKAANNAKYCYFQVKYCTGTGCKDNVAYVLGYNHVKPANVAKCASSYVCEHCGKTVYLEESHFLDDVATLVKQSKKLFTDFTPKVAVPTEATEGAPKAKTIKVIDWNELSVFANQLFFMDTTGHKLAVTEETKTCGKVYTVSCSECGESVSFALPTSLKHNFQWETLVAPKCDSAYNDYKDGKDGTEPNDTYRTGLRVKVCADCGAVNLLTMSEVLPQHTYVEQAVPATCTTPGFTVKVCKDCGNVVPVTAKNFTAPTGHKYNVEWIVETTHAGNGLLKISCKNCKNCTTYYAAAEDKDEVAKVVGVKNVKTYDDVAFNVSSLGAIQWSAVKQLENWAGIVKVVDLLHTKLDKDGNPVEVAKYYFVGYGLELLKNPIELTSPKAAGHSWTTWGVFAEPTCTNGTVWAPKCSKCGLVAGTCYGANVIMKDTKTGKYPYEDADALGHVVKTIVVAPTCGTAGYSYNVCTRCNYTLDKYGKQTTDSALTVDTTYKLPKANYTVADTFKFDPTAPLVGELALCDHAGPFKVVKKADVFEGGCKAHTCSVCGTVNGDLHDTNKLTYTAPAVKAGKKQITVRVENKGGVKYTIQVRKYGTANAGKWKNVKTVKKAGKFTVKNLKCAKYNVRICAVNAQGLKAYSKATKGVNVK